jgi:hypothetical protein
MAKGRKAGERAARLAALFEAGDHGAARRLAAEILGDAESSGDDREVAGDLLARTRPDRAVAAAGLVGAVAAVAVGAWLVVH